MLNDTSSVLDFLRTRRSYPPALLTGPGPDEAALNDLLAMAARVPDHGKLEPWRFVVIRGAARESIGAAVEQVSLAAGNPPEKAAKSRNAFKVPVVVAVVSQPKDSAKVPGWEQFLSAGAVCLGLVNAALASGYGASWLTGIAAEPDFARQHLGLAEGERIAGLIHIGTPGEAPPERPRPDLAARVTVLE
ncbi:MAG: nitroreductase [Paracoccus sp. (in: a-proteobacteria)]|nr:nitroreductase [Paracoccus sp. (in: a-proteobacteria)]